MTPESSKGVEYDDFEVRAFALTGMFFEDMAALVDAEDALRLERLNRAGYCCLAGYRVSPDPCPWH